MDREGSIYVSAVFSGGYSGRERKLYRHGEVWFPKGFLKHHRVRPARPDGRSGAGDEHVRDEPSAKDLLDGRDPASIAQTHVEDDQVWSAATSSRYRVELGGFDCTDFVTHPGKNVGIGTDHTLFAKIDGRIEYRTKAKGRTYVSVLPMTEAAAE